jgi:hypothetical protein
MRQSLLILVAATLLLIDAIAAAQRPGEIQFDAGTTFGVSGAGTLGSRDIFGALAPGRHLIAASTEVDVMVHRGRKTSYRWEFEVLPLVEISDPHDVQTVTVTLNTGSTKTMHYDTLDLVPCVSNTSNGPYYQINSTGTLTQIGTYTAVQTCSTAWTYAGGVSALGQRVNFRPRHRLQPYGIVNAGFLGTTRKLPISSAAQFNFTVEAGAGIEFFQRPKRSLALDVRYHHTSNGGRGDYNPGIDNVMFKLSYRLSR